MTDFSDSSPHDDYLLGSHDEELSRLGFQHRIWAQQAHSLWENAGFAYGDTILDLGCGPGFTTMDLAHLVGPNGKILAVDASEKFLKHLDEFARAHGLTNIEIIKSDVHELMLGESTVDGAYARWLMGFLKDPKSVVAMVAHAMRPGSAFAVTDYFNYRAFTFAPRSEALDRVVAAVEKAWAIRGGDLAIQGRMPGIMLACGLEVTEIRSNARIARPGSPLWNWPATFFHNFLPTLLDMGLITADDRNAFKKDWQERSNDPAAFLCIPPMYDVIGMKR
jgi:SAM-dependent methyltransferase